jgi:flagellar protein FliO/FliZ
MLLTAVTQSLNSFLQFMTVLVIFIIVLFITYFTTRWIAGYQKNKMSGSNIQVVETSKIAGNKYVQILRIGSKYIAVAVCKDTVTALTEIPPEQIHEVAEPAGAKDFSRIFAHARKNAETDHKDTDN